MSFGLRLRKIWSGKWKYFSYSPSSKYLKAKKKHIFNSFFVQVENRQIQIDGLKAEVMKRFSGEEKNSVPIKEIVDECGSISHPERCEQAKEIKNCLDKMSLLRGFN